MSNLESQIVAKLHQYILQAEFKDMDAAIGKLTDWFGVVEKRIALEVETVKADVQKIQTGM